MKTMAMIDENNVVVNIVCCNDDEPESKNLITYTEDNPAYIGGDYIDGYFYPLKPNCGHNELTLNNNKQWECSNAEHQITEL